MKQQTPKADDDGATPEAMMERMTQATRALFAVPKGAIAPDKPKRSVKRTATKTKSGKRKRR